MFSEYCDAPFEVEAAEVVSPDGTSHIYPTLSFRTETVQKEKINKLVGMILELWFTVPITTHLLSFFLSFLGINQSAERIAELLTKMCLSSKVQKDGETITVEIPPTRYGQIFFLKSTKSNIFFKSFQTWCSSSLRHLRGRRHSLRI